MAYPDRRAPSRLRSLLGAGALAALSPLVAGCPSNFCLLQVNGRCEISTCGSGELFDDRRQVCVCEPGRLAVGGGCLTQPEANRYCGRGAVWTPHGCAPITCAPGFILDLGIESCMPKQAVDQAAGVAPGQTLACGAGTVLIVSNGAGSCVPVDQTCARDEVWSGQGCEKLPTCPTGFAIDPSSRVCAPVEQRPQGGDLATIDALQWSRSTYGVDGGQGSPGLCGPIARKPLDLGVLPGGSIRVVISLMLSFPQGTTDGGVVISQALVEASGQPVTPRGAQEIQATADALLSSLRAQRAKTTLPAVQSTVRCLIVNGSAPHTVPTTGGA